MQVLNVIALNVLHYTGFFNQLVFKNLQFYTWDIKSKDKMKL